MKTIFFILIAITSLRLQAQEKMPIANYVKNNDRLAMVFDVNNRGFLDALNNQTATIIEDGKFKSGTYITDFDKASCVIVNPKTGFIQGGVVDFDTDSVVEETHYVGQWMKLQFSGFINMGPQMDCFKPTPGPFTDQDLNSIFGKLGEVFQWQKLNANEYNPKLYLK